MNYAIKIEEEIVVYNLLPKNWKGANGYRKSATPEQLGSDGFFEYKEIPLKKYEEKGINIEIWIPVLDKDDLEVVDPDTGFVIMEFDHYSHEVIDITPPAQQLYDELMEESIEVFNDFEDRIFKVDRLNILKGNGSRIAVRNKVTEMEVVKTRIKDALQLALDTDDLITLKNFSFDTEESIIFKQQIKDLKE